MRVCVQAGGGAERENPQEDSLLNVEPDAGLDP